MNRSSRLAGERISPMADIDIRCKECDALLEGEFIKWGQTCAVLVVEPCSVCLESAKQKGIEEGKGEE